MAKEKENKPKGKVRVFLFELEGSDDTLLESIKSISVAVGRTFGGPNTRTVVKTLPLPVESSDEALIDDGLEETDEVDEITEGDDYSSSSTLTKSKRARKFPTPKVLDLDLTSGDMTLKVFCEKKKPDDQRGKYMVIATWLKEYRNIDELSIDHIYTGYRAMSWNPPKDMGKVFRDAKRDGLFDSGTKRGTWKINHIGLGRILSDET